MPVADDDGLLVPTNCQHPTLSLGSSKPAPGIEKQAYDEHA